MKKLLTTLDGGAVFSRRFLWRTYSLIIEQNLKGIWFVVWAIAMNTHLRNRLSYRAMVILVAWSGSWRKNKEPSLYYRQGIIAPSCFFVLVPTLPILMILGMSFNCRLKMKKPPMGTEPHKGLFRCRQQDNFGKRYYIVNLGARRPNEIILSNVPDQSRIF